MSEKVFNLQRVRAKSKWSMKGYLHNSRVNLGVSDRATFVSLKLTDALMKRWWVKIKEHTHQFSSFRSLQHTITFIKDSACWIKRQKTQTHTPFQCVDTHRQEVSFYLTKAELAAHGRCVKQSLISVLQQHLTRSSLMTAWNCIRNAFNLRDVTFHRETIFRR